LISVKSKARLNGTKEDQIDVNGVEER